MYIDRCGKFNINTVVFNGTLITKNATQKARSNKMPQIIEISDENAWPLD